MEIKFEYIKNCLFCNGKATSVRLYSQYTCWYTRYKNRTLYRGNSRKEAEEEGKRFYLDKITTLVLKKREAGK